MLEITGLRVVYSNGFEALRAVDLTVGTGEIVAVIGRSGAGKSTLLRCVNGLRAGHRRLGAAGRGRRAAAGRRELRALQRRIGFIWQEYNLVERLSVLEQRPDRAARRTPPAAAACSATSTATHREIALRSLERVNLLHRATQRADRLSGGEKQRVAIARALAQKPSLHPGRRAGREPRRRAVLAGA